MASQEAITEQTIMQDRPTIDSAVKSFVSLKAAQSLTGQHGSTTEDDDSLQQARFLLQAINSYTFPLKANPSDDYRVVSQVWNALIASHQKPSRFLGRRALLYAWKNGLPEEIVVSKQDDCSRLFYDEFASLLFTYNPNPPMEQDSDACLVWDNDRGQAELARRRQRRAQRAQRQQQQASSAGNILPTLEEHLEENEKSME